MNIVTLPQSSSVAAVVFVVILHASGVVCGSNTWTYTMFGEDKSFILYEPFKLDTVRGALLTFRFKTTEPTVLLLYADDKIDNKADRCYVQLGLKGGRVSLMLRMTMKVDQGYFDMDTKELFLGDHLNDDTYHYVEVFLRGAALKVDVDHWFVKYTLPRRLVFTLNSPIHVGGIPEEHLKSEKNVYFPAYAAERFKGCISQLQYWLSGNKTTEMKLLKIVDKLGASQGCVDKCLSQPSLQCENRGRCLNLYSRTACNCRGTGFTGPTCTKASRPLYFGDGTCMELRSLGNNNQDELVVSPVTSKIIMRFRAANASGILLQVNDDDFDGDGGDGGRLLVELYQRTLIVALKLKGLKEEVVKWGEQNTDDPTSWKFLQIITDSRKTDIRYHDGNVQRRYARKTYSDSHTMPLASLNPKKIFVGGVPSDRREIFEGSRSKKDFVGCLDDVVINHKDILEMYREKDKSLSTHGIVPEQCSESHFEWFKTDFKNDDSTMNGDTSSALDNLNRFTGNGVPHIRSAASKDEVSANSSLWIVIGACAGIVMTTVIVFIVYRIRRVRASRKARNYSEHYLRRTAMALQTSGSNGVVDGADDDIFATGAGEQKCIRDEIAKRRLLKTFSPVRKDFYVSSATSDLQGGSLIRTLHNEPLYQQGLNHHHHDVLHHDHPYVGQNFATSNSPQVTSRQTQNNNHNNNHYHHQNHHHHNLHDLTVQNMSSSEYNKTSPYHRPQLQTTSLASVYHQSQQNQYRNEVVGSKQLDNGVGGTLLSKCSHGSRYQVPLMVRHDSTKSSISSQQSSFFNSSLTNE